MTLASFSDRVALPTGHFTLEVRRAGALIERTDEANLVVTGARNLLAGLLGGRRAAPGLALMGFGTSMVAADFGNAALLLPYTRPFEAVTYADGTVTFGFALPVGEANGLLIGEFGLLSADGVLFARKTRTYAAIPKDINLSLSGTWSIQF